MLIKLFVIFLTFQALSARAWELKKMGGVESEYTDLLKKHLGESEQEGSVELAESSKSVEIKCYSNSKNSYYVGASQRYEILSSIEKVEKLLLSFDEYPKWFDGLVKSTQEKEKDYRFIVSFEQYVPVPFVSNIKYKMIYETESSKDQKLVRYQLLSAGSIKAYDGYILLKKRDAQHTQVIEYDFIDAELGAAKIMGESSIWSQSLRGMVQTDYAVKIRAENPELEDKEVMKMSKAMAKETDVKKCIDSKTQF